MQHYTNAPFYYQGHYVSILFESYCNIAAPGVKIISARAFQFSLSLIATIFAGLAIMGFMVVSILFESYCNVWHKTFFYELGTVSILFESYCN